MRYSDLFWNEFVHGGHWFSISASALAFSTMILLSINIKWELLVIVYLLFQAIYNYNHYKEIEIDSLSNSDRSKHLKKYPRFFLSTTTFYSIGFLCLLFYFGTFTSFLFGLVLLLIGLLFTILFKKVTKKLMGFKTFYTSFSLSLLIFFTALYCSYEINLLLFKLFLFFSLRFVVGASFSDIKDMDADKKQNLLTFAVYFGKDRFLTFLHILNFITFVPLFITLIEESLSFLLFLIFTCIYTFYFIQRAKNPKVDIHYLTSIIVDGEFIFWPFFLFIGFILLKY
jgi:4-hydroxybenzoate polyprenyltransferase